MCAREADLESYDSLNQDALMRAIGHMCTIIFQDIEGHLISTMVGHADILKYFAFTQRIIDQFLTHTTTVDCTNSNNKQPQVADGYVLQLKEFHQKLKSQTGFAFAQRYIYIYIIYKFSEMIYKWRERFSFANYKDEY